MYKIFFYDRVLVICNNWTTCCSQPNAIIYKVMKISEIKNIIKQFQKNRDMTELWLFTENPEETMNEVVSLYTLIEAGGGIVHNTRGELLLIFRHECWDLPKGKCEPGETIAETALREVGEECGISDLTLFNLLAHSYHIYKDKETFFLKKTHWFSMQYNGHAPLVLQEAEGIKQAQWVTVTHLPEYFPGMFSSIVDLLRRVIL
jgi:8-oxo-dGTP pyrophosphatase MutT (NUDIX family)